MSKEQFVIYRLNYSPQKGLTFTERYFMAEYKPPTKLLPARYAARALKPFVKSKSPRHAETLTLAELLQIEDVPIVRRGKSTFRVVLIRRQSPLNAPHPRDVSKSMLEDVAHILNRERENHEERALYHREKVNAISVQQVLVDQLYREASANE